MDSMSVELLAAGVPMELRLSKDFIDALARARRRMNKPTVAIVGRPNVGKSTLFNRIIGGRPAIVCERPGTTRDRHFGDAEWQGRKFWVVDTGGLVPESEDSMDRAIRQQVDFAVDEADVVVFVVDGREGLNPVDKAIAEHLRRAKRPVVLAVNKLDDLERSTAQYDFYQLGFGDPLGVSAAVGKGSGDLLDAVVERLPPFDPAEGEETIPVAVVGRPNAGKSSLVNRLLGEERHMVAPEAGTTRDAIDSLLRYRGKNLKFIDTAGLRRRAKVEDDLEFYSTLRTERAIERAQVSVLVVDATLGMHNQDLRIATQAWEQGSGLIVVVNKWDLVEEKDANTAHRGQEELVAKAPFLRYVPFVYVSALTGQRVRRILDLILEVAEGREHRVPTAEVNRVLSDAARAQRAAAEAGRGGQAALCLPDRRGPADLRHREQPARRRARRVSALPRARLPRGVAVRRLAAPAEVHRAGLAAADAAGRCPGSSRRTCWAPLPTSYLAARFFGGIDLREHGSRNLGATNLYRVLGWKYAIPVGVLDAAKGLVPVLVFAPQVSSSELFALVCGLTAVAWSRVLGVRRLQGREGRRHRGGRDAGAHAGRARRRGRGVGGARLCHRLRVARQYRGRRRCFHGGCLSAGPAGAAAILWLDIAVAAAIIWLHRANILRLLKGTENRFGRRAARRRAHDRVAVLGAGSWGTTLANLLAAQRRAGPTLGVRAEVVEAVNRHAREPAVPARGASLPATLRAVADPGGRGRRCA